MNNFHVGQQCLIVGVRFKGLEENIGKVVTLIECDDFGCEWNVSGDSLTGRYSLTGIISTVNSLWILAKHLMPLDGLEETEQNKHQELVY